MKNFYISLIIGIIFVTGICYYQNYVENVSREIIERVESENVEKEWKKLKTLLFVFNDHEDVEEIDNEFVGIKVSFDAELKNKHIIYFKKKLNDLIEASKVKLVNIM